MVVDRCGWDGWVISEGVCRDLCPVRGEYDAKKGRKGPALYAVRQCKYCRTIWNRDVNAARNIGFVFWWLRTHGGVRPPGFRRTVVDGSGGGGEDEEERKPSPDDSPS